MYIIKMVDLNWLAYSVALYSAIIFALICVVLFANSPGVNWAIFALSLVGMLAGGAGYAYMNYGPRAQLMSALSPMSL